MRLVFAAAVVCTGGVAAVEEPDDEVTLVVSNVLGLLVDPVSVTEAGPQDGAKSNPATSATLKIFMVDNHLPTTLQCLDGKRNTGFNIEGMLKKIVLYHGVFVAELVAAEPPCNLHTLLYNRSW